MRALVGDKERNNVGRPKMAAVASSGSSGSDVTPMRGNTTTSLNLKCKAIAPGPGEWIEKEKHGKDSSVKRSLVGKMPLGMHPPPKLSLHPPDPSKAKVKHYHKYNDSQSFDKTELKKETSDESDTTRLAGNRNAVEDITMMSTEKQLEYYKEKLLQLAKSHAALLATCHQKKRFGKVEIRVKPEHLRHGYGMNHSVTRKDAIKPSSSLRRANMSVLEEINEEESTQVESTEDQLISFSQLTHQTSAESKCDNSLKENTTASREMMSPRSDVNSQKDSSSNNVKDGKAIGTRRENEDEEEEKAIVLGDDSSFPMLSQESYNTLSLRMPVEEYNNFKEFMQEIEGLTAEENPAETIFQQFARNNSLMTRQSSMGQEESILQEFDDDDGQGSSLGTFPADGTTARAVPLPQHGATARDINVHDSSHVGFSQLSQLPVDLHDDNLVEQQQGEEPSQLTQSSTTIVKDIEPLYNEEQGGSQRFEPKLLSSNVSISGVDFTDLPSQSQLTQTSIDSSAVHAFSPRPDKSPKTQKETSQNQTITKSAQSCSTLSFHPEHDMKRDTATHYDDEEDIDEEETQLEDSQLTQFSLTSSVFHPFQNEKDSSTTLQCLDTTEIKAPTITYQKFQAEVSQSSTIKNVRVGVGVLVKDPLNPNKIFAGIRKGSHGAGELALPGGHLEMFESWEKCAIREVKEETDLDIVDVKFGHVTNDIMKEKHYVTIFMLATVKGAVLAGAASPQPSPQPSHLSSSARGRKRKASAAATSGLSLRRSSRGKKSRKVSAEEELVTEKEYGREEDTDELVDPEKWTPKNMEPNKCEGWGSYSWEELMKLYHNNDNEDTKIKRQQCRLFGPLRQLLEDKPNIVQEFFSTVISSKRGVGRKKSL